MSPASVETAQSLQSKSSSISTLAELEAIPDLVVNEKGLQPEEFDDGFCPDDIYATYLTKQYATTALSHELKNKNLCSQRAHPRMSCEELAALHFARLRMNGPTMPYLGTVPIVVNAPVDFWIRYFKTSGRRDFMRWMVRAQSLKDVLQPILQNEGVPAELFYLAMVESGFTNHAASQARAAGTWQFMKRTAQRYGLKINHWVDERRDPVKATHAAARYLRDLYTDLGDWNLALAAYNAGPGKIKKAVRRVGSNDYWRLSATSELAQETKNYVPKVMAAILLATNAKAHGFAVSANPIDGIPTDKVVLPRSIRLDELAASLGTPVAKLKQWNPELLQNITPPAKSGYPLRLSPEYAQLYYREALNKLSAVDLKDVQMHVVSRGDTLARIAKKYNVEIQEILMVNPKINAKRLTIGHAIAIPAPEVAVNNG